MKAFTKIPQTIGIYNTKRGFSLIGALLLLVIVSMTMAVIGTLFLKSLKVQHELKVYKTTKEAAESAAYAVIEYIDSEGEPPVKNCKDDTGNPCTPNCSDSNCRCEIDWDAGELKEVKEAIEKSPTIGQPPQGYLLKKCTEGDTKIYTIEILVSGSAGGGTRILFIYAH